MIYPQGGFGPFLSTPSARRATAGRHGSSATVAISIHALREEGDPPSSKSGRPSANFYPRPPRGGRLFCAARAASSRVFLSTPSARRATRAGEPFLLLPEISIHALREEGDVLKEAGRVVQKLFLSTPSARRATAALAFLASLCKDFYPRPPRGGRPWKQALMLWQRVFLSTPSARRATCCPTGGNRSCSDFYPRPPRGGRHFSSCSRRSLIDNFYPRPPRGGRR